MLVHRNASLAVVDTDVIESEIFHVRLPTHAYQYAVGCNALRFLLFGEMQEEFAVGLAALYGCGCRIEAEVNAAPLEGSAQAFRHVAVETGQHFAYKLNDCDLCAECAEHRCQLQADNAAADNGETFGQGGFREQFGGGDHAVEVCARYGQGARTRAGGNDDVVGREALAVNDDGFAAAIGGKLRPAFHEPDVGMLQQGRYALHETCHDAVFPPHGLREVNARRAFGQADAK